MKSPKEPKTGIELLRRMRKLTPNAISELELILRDEDNPRVLMDAIKLVFEYTLPKPETKQRLDIDVRSQVDKMTNEEILLRLRQKMGDYAKTPEDIGTDAKQN